MAVLTMVAGAICDPFADEGFRFRPGAIAVHIHSFSASWLRDPLACWCGPLPERGATVTLETMSEPYLRPTAHLEVFKDRLMNVVLCDPLYRPYASWRRQEMWKDTATGWQQYRGIIMAAGEDVPSAAQLRRAAEQSSSMFFDSLAAAQADASEGTSAIGTVDNALGMETKRALRLRLMLIKTGMLAASGNESVADLIKSQTTGRLPSHRHNFLKRFAGH